MKRCSWVRENNPLYVVYHDTEWGKPLHDDQALLSFYVLKLIKRTFLGDYS